MFKFSMLSAGRSSNFEAIMKRIASKELIAKCVSFITPLGSKAADVASRQERRFYEQEIGN